MKLVEEFVNNWLKFYLDINDKKGINKEKLELLEKSLFCLKEEYSPKGYIPLKVGNIFIDIQSSLESLSSIYPESEQKEILYTAEYLASLARDVCSNS